MDVKPFYTSRTFWVAVLTVLIGAGVLVSEFLAKGDFSPSAITLIVVGVANVILRFLTSEPVK